ncbi:hypothetical protein KR200_006990 [Drosophila serrata]|nr:hypothetical protein KR200_006990 [Drosophila serrata]
MFLFILGSPLSSPPFTEGQSSPRGLDSLWACGTARSLSLNLKRNR